MFLFMFDINAKIEATCIGVPYGSPFPKQVGKKYQPIRAGGHLCRFFKEVGYIFFKIGGIQESAKLPGKPFKNDAAIIGWPAGNIISIGKQVIEKPLILIFQNFFVCNSY